MRIAEGIADGRSSPTVGWRKWLIQILSLSFEGKLSIVSQQVSRPALQHLLKGENHDRSTTTTNATCKLRDPFRSDLPRRHRLRGLSDVGIFRVCFHFGRRLLLAKADLKMGTRLEAKACRNTGSESAKEGSLSVRVPLHFAESAGGDPCEQSWEWHTAPESAPPAFPLQLRGSAGVAALVPGRDFASNHSAKCAPLSLYKIFIQRCIFFTTKAVQALDGPEEKMLVASA